ncbi:hypothetical protein NZA98_36040, partial [Escherichia coli]|nr:hypothetical protein [Escherichia coli]
MTGAISWGGFGAIQYSNAKIGDLFHGLSEVESNPDYSRLEPSWKVQPYDPKYDALSLQGFFEANPYVRPDPYNPIGFERTGYTGPGTGYATPSEINAPNRTIAAPSVQSAIFHDRVFSSVPTSTTMPS